MAGIGLALVNIDFAVVARPTRFAEADVQVHWYLHYLVRELVVHGVADSLCTV